MGFLEERMKVSHKAKFPKEIKEKHCIELDTPHWKAIKLHQSEEVKTEDVKHEVKKPVEEKLDSFSAEKANDAEEKLENEPVKAESHSEPEPITITPSVPSHNTPPPPPAPPAPSASSTPPPPPPPPSAPASKPKSVPPPPPPPPMPTPKPKQDAVSAPKPVPTPAPVAIKTEPITNFVPLAIPKMNLDEE